MLYSVSPDFGSTKGGEEVRISGVGLTEDTSFVFGSRKAKVKQCGETSCVVSTPAGNAGRVNVSAGQKTLKGAYEYIVVPAAAPLVELANTAR